MYSKWQAAVPGYSVAYNSYYTLSLTDILVQGRGCYTLSYRLITDWYFGVQCRWQVFVYFVFDWYSGFHLRWQAALPWVTDWYTDVQCSLQLGLDLLYRWPIFLYTLHVTDHYTPGYWLIHWVTVQLCTLCCLFRYIYNCQLSTNHQSRPCHNT